EVARDLEETRQITGGITQSGDHHARPEASSILAQSPAFVLHPPLARGDLQLLVGPAVGDGLRLVETGEVAAENLLGLVTLDVFRAVIPAGDVAGRIEGEDGVVLDARYQLLERP